MFNNPFQPSKSIENCFPQKITQKNPAQQFSTQNVWESVLLPLYQMKKKPVVVERVGAKIQSPEKHYKVLVV